jgi:hypothetical protein
MLPAAVPSLPSAPAALATGRQPLRHWLHWGAPLALTALAYAAVAVLVALAVALPADHASPLNPAAGIAWPASSSTADACCWAWQRVRCWRVEVMRGVLAQRAQVQLEVSMTGLDALAAVRSLAPHLILLDMHLPDISGSGAVAAPAARSSDGLDTKPVDVTELLAVVDALLDPMDTGFR